MDIVYKLFTGTLSLEFSRPLLPVPIVFLVVYLLRHFKDIREEYRRHMANTRPWQYLRWVQTTGRAFKYFVIAQWSGRYNPVAQMAVPLYDLHLLSDLGQLLTAHHSRHASNLSYAHQKS
ncbi:hypothetical protein AAF712_005454 [Marasmius tenuissimus]|uniref:Uncharacterized protein n=1 Tax=Marasmius tenuissimus TaxID=585030 RepID=A0ABR3A0S8_9AGAR